MTPLDFFFFFFFLFVPEVGKQGEIKKEVGEKSQIKESHQIRDTVYSMKTEKMSSSISYRKNTERIRLLFLDQ